MTGREFAGHLKHLCLLAVCPCLALFAAETPAPKTSAPPPASTAKDDPKKPPLGQITVLVPKKDFKTEGPAKALRVSFDDLDIEKVLNTKQLSLKLPERMPDWMKGLDGKRLRVRGFMHPQSVFETEGIRRFVLCRDTSACCFGPNPTIYYLIDVTLKSGQSTNYIENKAFDVEGVLKIKPEQLEGTDEIYQFYYLEDATVVKR